MTMIPAFGGYVYSSLFATVYEAQGKVLCKGNGCFEETFIFAFVTCCICAGVNVILFVRKRNY
jgi:hypothetical protein